MRGRLSQRGNATATDRELPSQPSFDDEWMRASSFHSLSKKTLRKLVDYWDKHIAGLMVWVDSEANPYRLYVIPLAYSNPVIGLAMAAVSSQHASTLASDIDFPEKARNEAVEMISIYVKDITSHVMSGHELGQKLDENSVVWVLAAMLLLSCYEMAHSGAAAADYHRRAARSLVNTFETTGRTEGVLLNFLRNQLSLHDVFACTTSFDLSTMQGVILPDTEDTSVLFSTYLGYLHDVTLLSRMSPQPSTQCPRMGLTFSHIQAQFEVARGETLMTAGRLSLQPSSRRRDFIRLVAIHHYAALLYAARCLELDTHGQENHLVDALFDKVAAMEAINEWVHSIAWPLFIAGVESHGEESRQALVTDMYGRISKKMGFQNFCDALRFLQEFWEGGDQDWRVMARRWEVAGRPVLPA